MLNQTHHNDVNNALGNANLTSHADAVATMHIPASIQTRAKYPMIRTEMRQFPLDNGASSKEINNPFHGKVSQRVILAFYKPHHSMLNTTKTPLCLGNMVWNTPNRL